MTTDDLVDLVQKHQLALTHLLVLRHVHKHGPSSVSDIRNAIKRSESNTRLTVDALEFAGLVKLKRGSRGGSRGG